MRNLNVSREMIENYLPKHLVDKVLLETIEVCNASYIDKELKQSYSDMLYKVQTKSKSEAYIYFLWEHQSTYDKNIAFRLLMYACNIMQDHLEAGNSKLPIIIPALVSAGAEDVAAVRAPLEITTA
jgi:predicted transposase/invertase (TIGR01784 family)